MPLLGTAALAIWHGIQAGGVPAFEQYHTLEHMPERLGIPGFLRGRRYRGEVDGAFHCFTLYETAHGEVLRSPPYLARLNAPTDWTQRIQPTMTGFLRGACDVQCSLGLGVGAAAGTWRLAGTPHASACAAAKPQQPVPVNSPAAAPLGAAAAALLAGTLMMQPGVCGAHVLRHRPTVTSQATGETALRPSTSAEHFDALLVLEAIEIGYLREAQHAVAQAVAAAGLAIAGNGRGALYHLGYHSKPRAADHTMKAIAKLKPEPGAMALIDVDEPAAVDEPGGLIRLKILAGGICGTDVAIWKWHQAVVGQYAPSFPLIVGHEFAGTVASANGRRVKPGDVVAVNPQIACGRCHWCGLGRPTLCEDRKLMGGRINGGWTETVLVPEQNLTVLPPEADAAVAPLLEPLSVATHAVLERVPVRAGDVVAVIGAGPIGLLCAVLALHAGASKVLITGLGADAGRLRLAAELGAIPVNVEASDPLAAVRALQRDGADIVYESSGAPAVLDQAIAMTRRSGSLGLIGLCHGSSQVLSTPIVLRELAVIGSRGYNETTWALMMRVLPAVQRQVLRLVSHELPYAEFEDALRLVEARQGNKIILRP